MGCRIDRAVVDRKHSPLRHVRWWWPWPANVPLIARCRCVAYSLSELTVEIANRLPSEEVAPSRTAIWRLLTHDAFASLAISVLDLSP